MKKNIFFVVLSLAMLLSCTQCTDRKAEATDGYGKEYPHTFEAISIIDSCMSFAQADPARSHRIIDSVCQAKLMSPSRCDYYHAMVVYMGEDNLDSALAICNKLLDEARFGDDGYLEEEVCVLASNITLSVGRYLETLEYANRGIAICHGQELMSADEATLMGRAGQAEQMLGRTEEAIQTYAEANQLLQDDRTFAGLVARISLMMKQASLYYDTAEYDRAIDASHAVLALVEGFHRDPSTVENRPDPMSTSGDVTRSFADFYQSQLYAKIAKSYRGKAEQDDSRGASANLDSLNLYLDKWEQTQSHKTPDNLAKVMRELFFTGRMAQFNEARQAVTDLYKGDSIVPQYVDYLDLLAQEAASRHDFQASSGYLQRALAISDSIRRQETLRTLSEQMAINMVQQQQLARQEAEYRASRYRLINVIIVVIIVILAASGTVIALLRRRNRQKEEMLQKTQHDLDETREEVNEIIQQLEETKRSQQAANQQAYNPQELYCCIEQVVKEKELYLNPDFNIVMLADILGTNRTFISMSVNSVTGKSFRAWLAEYRLNLYLEKQKKAPDTPIDHLLSQCGYKDQSTFHRQFKAAFGVTPSQYRKTSEVQYSEETEETEQIVETEQTEETLNNITKK